MPYFLFEFQYQFSSVLEAEHIDAFQLSMYIYSYRLQITRDLFSKYLLHTY